jgi:hypothetical protein
VNTCCGQSSIASTTLQYLSGQQTKGDKRIAENYYTVLPIIIHKMPSTNEGSSEGESPDAQEFVNQGKSQKRYVVSNYSFRMHISKTTKLIFPFSFFLCFFFSFSKSTSRLFKLGTGPSAMVLLVTIDGR